ncbi:putative LRR receptor-like serine/threonine-protein kinase MEE39 [Acorus gramineus]|uniref:LRR receptor-like serine/threonine-protein kinase MEE39 n=1 Tax=Acorus gramineus TaxID=55184 RepID=A0AAV8ZYF3_ACOGR|nr:putative LRR receptor-like serine/threonine-protein kinase MEE39 [Acorus gramineus]
MVEDNNSFNLPPLVMSTAVTQQPLEIILPNVFPDGYHIYLHFEELTPPKRDESREFIVKLNGGIVFPQPVQLTYLFAYTIYTTRPWKANAYKLSMEETTASTLPPILNAAEMYYVLEMSYSPTYEQDVEAIITVKNTYNIKKGWSGDPCFQNVSWDGLNCNTNDSGLPRIVSL